MKKFFYYHILFISVAFVLSIVSCTENNDTELIVDPIESKIFKYNFSEEYKITEINRYIGPSGEKIKATEEYLTELWPNIKTPEKKSLIIQLNKDSLFFKDGLSTLSFKIKTIQDSVFINYDSDVAEFFGLFDATKKTFYHYSTYYFRRFEARIENGIYGGAIFHKGSNYGVGRYSDHFYENGFKSPIDMTKSEDEIFWVNLIYEFDLIP